MNLWLVGAGSMARDYAKVLTSLNCTFKVFSRGEENARLFTLETGLPVSVGGVEQALTATAAPDIAIVAVGVEALARTAVKLIAAGTRRILLEKPGCINTADLRTVQQAAAAANAEVSIAYNRRFYASTEYARASIADDGGPTACTFEFTEWSHVISPLAKAAGVKEAWFLANSSHVPDLAFHLCGTPARWQAWHDGHLEWHPTSARFCGAGVTDRRVMFSYIADWEAPGRWGLEVLTHRRRYIFRPLEKLQIIEAGSLDAKQIALDDRLDKEFKPGLHHQTRVFLSGTDTRLCTIDEQLRHCEIFDAMAGYSGMQLRREGKA